MKRLILIRHGKTEQVSKSGNDFDRKLVDRGKKDAALMAKQLFKREIYPDLIVSSPAIRARKTAVIFAETMKYDVRKIVFEEKLYHEFVEKESYIRLLEKFNNKIKTVYIIGHNPYISEMAIELTGNGYEHIPTCGLKCIDFDIDTWEEFSLGTGKLFLFDFPENHR